MSSFDHRELARDLGTALEFAPGERLRVSNIAHHSDIHIGNMQLKMKEILHRPGCGISGK